ncbi:MAG TPA: threonine/serine dehydratase [Aggregatilineales bacterium]|nr:threonine/serine dehydratase [Anaerolineales bacterium]HRE46944.1 threonine/serine dehydratase [Aggregatilineales bacterium]
MTIPLVTLADIQRAQQTLRGVAFHTPLLPAFHATADGTQLWLKPENLQPIGSFKIRGASHKILSLDSDVRARGVIAYSSGNHAQGVAFAAKACGIPAVIVMPNNAPAVKIEATRGYGAQVVLYDPATESREAVAAELMAGQAWTLVPPFDDPLVIAGQGTIGAEIYADLPTVNLVLVPIGGGGLISGVAATLKHLNPAVKLIGVEPALANDAQQSFRGGALRAITPAEAWRTIADGVRTLTLSDLTFRHMQAYVDEVITVTETEIRASTRELILNNHLWVEPSGALTYAAWRCHQAELPPAAQTVAIISGGSADPAVIASILVGG